MKLKTAQNKVIFYRQHSSVVIQLLIKYQGLGRVNVDELVKYLLTVSAQLMVIWQRWLNLKVVQLLVRAVNDAQLSGDTQDNQLRS